MNIFDVSQKTILIVGASSGIGEHFAKTLAKQGATLLIAARRIKFLQTLTDKLLQLGAKAAHAYQVDVSDPNDVQNLVTVIEADHRQIDVLIVAAGTNIRKPLTEYSVEDWNTVRAINLDGNWWTSQAVAKHMIKNQTAGSIVHLTSAADKRVLSISSQAYHATKAAMHQLTKSMAVELAPHKIRVNAIAPGFFETDLNRDMLTGKKGERVLASIPLGRTGQLAEMDGILLLLCSNASSYMTGTILRIDGGYATNHIGLDVVST
ncbi:MAG: SDR family oxidoreductase [Pseudomonadota bacterium]